MGKELRYRIVCPLCRKGFDSRTGTRLVDRHGIVVCPECLKTLKRFPVGWKEWVQPGQKPEEEESQNQKEEIQ